MVGGQWSVMEITDLKKRLFVPEELFENFLAAKGWGWQQLARKELPYSFEEIQLFLICSDPVLWSRAFLKESDTEAPYEYWPYQLPSITYHGDVIHSDGAEVGKTREIGNLILWKAFTKDGGSSLVGAPEQIHLDEIIDYCNEQMFNLNPDLGKGLKKHKKHPHHVFYFHNRHKIYFSPGGFDGTGFRGKHVDDLVIMDEAAKIKNPDIWREFWRAGKPSATFRIYSVPDGDRGTVYYKLKQLARGVNPSTSSGRTEEDGPEEDSPAKDRQFRFFNWKKPAQPEPFWSDQRRRFYIDLYGGEDSPGYRRNILGEDGDPENAVFPWHQFSRCLKEIPEYRVIKIMVDEGSGTVSVFSAQYGVVYAESRKEGREEILEDRTYSTGDFSIRAALKALFSPVPGLLYIGGDLGFSNDPTELVVRLVIGKTWRTIARVQLKGVTYDLQEQAIDALDDIFSPKGIGLDFGAAGSAVVHSFHAEGAYPGKHYDERLTGFQFAEALDDMDENGEVLIDRKTDKTKRLPAKELSTNIMVKKVQQQEMEYPYDPDYINQFPSHTYREGPRYRIFSKGNDHLIDAERVCTLKMIVPDNAGEDLFSSGN